MPRKERAQYMHFPTERFYSMKFLRITLF